MQQCPICGAPHTWQGSMSSGGLRPSCACGTTVYAEEPKKYLEPDPGLAPPPGFSPDRGLPPISDPQWQDPDYVWRMYSQRRIGAVDAYKMLELIRGNPKMLGAKDKAGKVIREIMHQEYFCKHNQILEDAINGQAKSARHTDDCANTPTRRQSLIERDSGQGLLGGRCYKS